MVSKICSTFCHTVWEVMAIIDISWAVRVRLVGSHCMRPSHRSESTTKSKLVPRCIQNSRAFRSVHAALQTTTAVVSIHESVWCRNAGNSMLRWSIYPRPCLFNLRNNYVLCAPSSSRILFRGRRRVAQANFLLFLWHFESF